jgi:hypothetical protein
VNYREALEVRSWEDNAQRIRAFFRTGCLRAALGARESIGLTDRIVGIWAIEQLSERGEFRGHLSAITSVS